MVEEKWPEHLNDFHPTINYHESVENLLQYFIINFEIIAYKSTGGNNEIFLVISGDDVWGREEFDANVTLKSLPLIGYNRTASFIKHDPLKTQCLGCWKVCHLKEDLYQ